MKRYATTLMCLMLSTPIFSDEGYRTFSDISGHTFKGRVLGYDAAAEVVFVERADGKKGRKQLAIFSDADRHFIVNWGASHRFLEGLELSPKLSAIAVSRKEIGNFDVTKKVYDSFYEIRFINKTEAPFEKINVEYCIFYNQGEREKNIVNYDEGVCHGEGVVENLNPSAEQVLKTKSIRLYTEGGRVGVFGADVVSIANMWGIWLRLTTTLPSGSEIVREYRTSDDIDWKWSVYTFGAGLNEGASTQTFYYFK